MGLANKTLVKHATPTKTNWLELIGNSGEVDLGRAIRRLAHLAVAAHQLQHANLTESAQPGQGRPVPAVGDTEVQR